MRKISQIKKIKKIGNQYGWVAGSALVMTGIAATVWHATPLIVPSNLAFVPYSDTHITEQAITTNPHVATETWDTIQKETGKHFDQTADVLEALPDHRPALPAATSLSAQDREYGTWLWTPVLQMTPAYMDQIISGAEKNHITAIYLSIDSYLDISALPDSADKRNQEEQFDSTLTTFIQKAHAAGIAVDAEAGWRNWAEDGNTYKAFAILDYALHYNATHPNTTLRGFQYDIEPYLLTNYTRDQSSILLHYIALIDQSAEYLGGNDLRLSIVVPEFYDDQSDIVQIQYDGKTEDVFAHILDILDTRPNSSIIVMSYRNQATGGDGSIALSSEEMTEAIGHATRIILAQETSDVQPPTVTFFGLSKNDYETQTNDLVAAFSNNPNFGGLAVHYVNTFLSLK